MEAEVQVAVKSEKSVVPEVAEKKTELTKLESTSEGLENNVRVEESSVSAVKTVEVQESVNISLEQSDFNGNSKEIEALVEPSMVEGVNQVIADDQACAKIDDDGPDNEEDEKASNQKHEDVENTVDAQEMDLAVEGDSLEPNRDVIQESTLGDDKLQGLGMDENDPKDEKVTVPHTELESDIVLSTGNDVHEIPILGKSDDEDEGVDNVRKLESNTNDQDGESEQEQKQENTIRFAFPDDLQEKKDKRNVTVRLQRSKDSIV
ncbi:unnamed protein product [Lactuca virosa]|uniref:Uncharacterized protein n=1 Tax=Lactuca virosa TaxID=75947 RepID=A0AAU9P0H5_9ASTR|nr:unnamed protein product [Lactuca virosa]